MSPPLYLKGLGSAGREAPDQHPIANLNRRLGSREAWLTAYQIDLSGLGFVDPEIRSCLSLPNSSGIYIRDYS